MSVHTIYAGRFGNNIFQYMSARLFAELNDLQMITKFSYENVLPTTIPKEGRVFNTPSIAIGEGIDIYGKKWPGGQYVFSGWFQTAAWYQDRREHLKNFFRLPSGETNIEDIVMHIRLGDYRIAWRTNKVIDASWYLKCLEMEKFRNLYIITEQYEKGYLDRFKKYNPIIYCGRNFLEDWLFMGRFDRAILSNSSYSWTSAFFGNVRKAYTFKRGIDGEGQNLSNVNYAIQVDGKMEGER